MRNFYLLAVIVIALALLLGAQTEERGKAQTSGMLTALATSHSVALTWAQPTTMPVNWTLASNSVYRATGTCPATSYTKIYASTIPVEAYTDTAVAGLVTYCYVVTDTASCSTCSPTTGESGYSNTLQVVIPADPPPTPPPPTNLMTGTVSLHNVPLFWNAPPPATGYAVAKYKLYRGSKATMPSPALIATVSSLILNYTDTTCKGTKYYYVKAYDQTPAGSYQLSTPSNIVQAICQ